LLTSLEDSGFIQRTANGFVIGIAAFEVGVAMPIAATLRQAVAPILDEIAVTSGEACHLGTLIGSDVVYLDRRDTGEGLRFATRIGQRLPAHATGLGKAMLATLSKSAIEERYSESLPSVTKHTVRSIEKLHAVLEDVRERGYAIESEESTPGVCCIGVATQTQHGPLGLSITVPIQRIRLDELAQFHPVLSEAILRISRLANAGAWLAQNEVIPTSITKATNL
jgi:DNA-binding IclR family transcriptional regulator